jgi:pimeloyl-ACP methyl ester carboxylesterase
MISELVSTGEKPCVVALHCSLGSGRQWHKLARDLGPDYQVIAPDIAGYGDNRGWLELPITLAEEIAALGDGIDQATGPVHLVGHSYGGAIAFRMATASPFAPRIRSLTLIEPVLPTLLDIDDADRCGFAQLSRHISADLGGRRNLQAIGKFMNFWNGLAPAQDLTPEARLHMLKYIEKIPFDFMAAFDEPNVADAAASIRVPTLLLSGGQSPRLTQRIVERLATTIAGAETRSVLTAGHMLPITHANLVNREIVAHIARADDLADVPGAERLGLASGLGPIGPSQSRELRAAPE